MARVIDTVLTLYDFHGNIYKRIPLTKEGILNEYMTYCLDLYTHNYTKFVIDVCLLYKVFNTCDLSHISNIEEVQRYYKIIRKTYEEIPRFKKEYAIKAALYISTLEFVKEFDVKNQTKVEECNFETIDIYFDDNERYMWLRTYPLIPEFITELNHEYKHIVKTGSDYEALIMGIVCDEYLNALSKKTSINHSYDESIEEIYQMGLVSRMNFFKKEYNGKEYYNNIKENVTNYTYVEPTYYNNPELFSQRLFNDFLRLKDLDFFNKLHDILLKCDSDKPDYIKALNDIDKLLKEKDKQNERMYLKNLVNIKGTGLIVSHLIVNFYAVYVSETYQKLEKEINGEQRTFE